MRKVLVYILKNSEFILFIYNLFFRMKNKSAFYRENIKRERMSFFDYQKLAAPIPYYPIEKLRDSNYYGYALAIRKYAGIKKLNAALEHGLYLGDRITTAEGYRTTQRVIAMSMNRVMSFKKHNLIKPIIAIGPYIHYAESLLNEKELAQLKKELGRVLLVMPVHSAKGFRVSFSHKLLIDFVESVKKDFDTILVCVHFRDILSSPDFVIPYEENGYRIVCAGNEYDYNFIRRLKSIILLSDYVVSNSHGTNTGFCTYLDKPQTIVFDKSLKKTHNSYTDEIWKIRNAQVKEIEEAFSAYNLEITDEQRAVVEKYWGISLIKSPEELREEIEKIS